MKFLSKKRNVILISISVCAYVFVNIISSFFDLSLKEGWFAYVAIGLILIPIILLLFMHSKDIKEQNNLKSKIFKFIGIYLTLIYIVLIVYFITSTFYTYN